MWHQGARAQVCRQDPLRTFHHVGQRQSLRAVLDSQELSSVGGAWSCTRCEGINCFVQLSCGRHPSITVTECQPAVREANKADKAAESAWIFSVNGRCVHLFSGIPKLPPSQVKAFLI